MLAHGVIFRDECSPHQKDGELRHFERHRVFPGMASAAEWTHVAATFNGSHSVMAVNGVPALVQSGLPCGGSIYCSVNAVGKTYTLVSSNLSTLPKA